MFVPQETTSPLSQDLAFTTSARGSVFIQHFGTDTVVWEMWRHSDECSYNCTYGAVQIFEVCDM